MNIKLTNIILSFLLVVVFLKGEEAQISLDNLDAFFLKGVDNKIYTKTDFNGENGNLIVFLSNHCKISQLFQISLISNYEKWKNNGIKLFCISPNYELSILPDELAYSNLGDSFQEMKLRAIEQKYNFPFLYDGEKQILTNQLNVKITPCAFLFDKFDRLIYFGKIGDIDKLNTFQNSVLSQKIEALIDGKNLKFSRTKLYGTRVKFEKDIKIAQDVAYRYSREKIRISFTDERRLNFFIEQKTDYPKLFYFWTMNDNEELNRENLITISKYFKIFRKRGFKVFTVCVGEGEKKDEMVEVLEKAQLSAINLYTSGTELTKASHLRPPIGNFTTPFTRLVSGSGAKLYGTVGVINAIMLRNSILQSLNDADQRQ